MTYYSYTLTLKSPLIVSAPAGDPNSASTYFYIPGSYIRGAVAAYLKDPGSDTNKIDNFRRLILDGTVRYLNAYPVSEGRRSLPSPVSLRVQKKLSQSDSLTKVIDLAAFTQEEWPDEQLAAIPFPFITLGAAQPKAIYPSTSSRYHHQRDRKKGRAWKEKNDEQDKDEQNKHEQNKHGTIYTYEYLEAGQQFAGLVQIAASGDSTSSLLKKVQECLKPPLFLGRSRRAGYGGEAELFWDKAPLSRELSGSGVLSENIVQGEQFRLQLLSPCIIRDRLTGQLDPMALEQELMNLFGGRVSIINKYLSFIITGGFNRKWRLELPQAFALSAGSVFLLEAQEDIAFQELLEVERAGFGERLAEGFGRIAFLKPPTKFQRFGIPSKDKVDQVCDTVPAIVHQMEERILKDALFEVVINRAVSLAGSANIETIPPTSLLGRLRVPLREKDLSKLKTWLGSSDVESTLRSTALKKLERCRIDGGMSLCDWMRGIIFNIERDPHNLQDYLNIEVIAQNKNIISTEVAKEKIYGMTNEIVIQLIDNVLAALAKRSKREAGKNA